MAVVGVLFVGWLIRQLHPLRFGVSTRLMGCLVGVLVPLWLAMTPQPAIADRISPSFSAHGETELTVSYRDHGFAIEFLKSAARESDVPQLPPDADIRLRQIVAKMKSDTPEVSPAVLPDIVVILSESFWDPTDLPHVTFSSDPVPFYHALRKEAGDLRFLSPSFGGRTAHVEFELLTGLSMDFLASGCIPYEDSIETSPVPSVVHLFGARGYHTLALHTYSRTFWRRDEVYPLMGFQEFHGDETFLTAPKQGTFLADAALGERIQEQLSVATQPTFLMAITMENHGPYTPGRYPVNAFTVNAPLSAGNRALLQTFAQGVSDADAMLGYLVSYLRTRPRPTVVIFFGDHLPAFSQGLGLYRDLGFVHDPVTPDDQIRLHSTPALIWASYPLNLHMQERIISPNLIWPELLRAIGVEHRFYTTFLDQVRRVSPGLSRSVCLTSSGTTITAPEGEARQILQDYHLLQYDLLQRHQMLADGMFTDLETLIPPR